MFGDCREALLDVREWSGGPDSCPEVVGRYCRMSGMVGSPYRMSGGCRKAIPHVRE